jgi:outer membrane protein OmpA-like peptidoglycan-associated protein
MQRIAVVSAIMALCLGCATKKHVRTQLEPIQQRIGTIESQNKQTEVALGELEKGISQAEEHAKTADGKAVAAQQSADKAQQTAVESGQRADAANQAAEGAKTLAQQGLAKADALDQRITGLDDYKLVSTDSVLFAFDRTKLDDEAKQALDQAVGRLRNHRRYVIEVQGFTDQIGTPAYNVELSRKRANEVVRYLTVEHKVPLHRIHVIGLGSALPVTEEKGSEARRKNRRVEVKVYSTDDAGKNVTATSAGVR